MSYSRFAVTISKKVDKRATKRNELRRLFMREIASSITDRTPPADILLIVKPLAATVSHEELAEAFLKSLSTDHL
jgi:ribonuclease P protein component